MSKWREKVNEDLCTIVPVVTGEGKPVYADGMQIFHCDTHFLFIRGVDPKSCYGYRAIRKLTIREHEEQKVKVNIPD